MRRNRGGDTVVRGYYWSMAKWEVTCIEQDGSPLPGGYQRRYVRVPVGLLLVAAPVMGLLFVIFLPFIGVALLLQRLAVAAVERLGQAMERLMGTMTPAWRPGVAFLAGTVKDENTEGEPESTEEPDRLDPLEREIEDRRRER